MSYKGKEKKRIIELYVSGVTKHSDIKKNTLSSMGYISQCINEHRQNIKSQQEKELQADLIKYLFEKTDNTVARIAHDLCLRVGDVRKITKNLVKTYNIKKSNETFQKFNKNLQPSEKYLFEDVIFEGKHVQTEFSDPSFIKKIQKAYNEIGRFSEMDNPYQGETATIRDFK